MLNQDLIKTLDELYEFALQDTESVLKIVDIGEVDEILAKKIQENTGLNLIGFKISVDTFSIKHIMKQHGNPFTEAQRGQLAVEKSDFFMILDIIQQADQITKDQRISTKTKQIIHESLVFRKTYQAEYVVIKEIRQVIKKGKINRIILQSMRKHPRK